MKTFRQLDDAQSLPGGRWWSQTSTVRAMQDDRSGVPAQEAGEGHGRLVDPVGGGDLPQQRGRRPHLGDVLRSEADGARLAEVAQCRGDFGGVGHLVGGDVDEGGGAPRRGEDGVAGRPCSWRGSAVFRSSSVC